MLRRILAAFQRTPPRPPAPVRLIDGAPMPDSPGRLPHWHSQQNTLVFTCTRVDSQYVIRETLASGLHNPFYLITSRSRAHFEALFSTTPGFAHRFLPADAPGPAGAAYDPLADCRDDDEIIDNLHAFEPLGVLAGGHTRLALAWIRAQGAHPNLPLLLRLLTSSGRVHPDSPLPDPTADLDPAPFRAGHLLAPDTPPVVLTALTRYYDEVNAALAHPWLPADVCLSPPARVVVLLDKSNRVHSFQMHGALRELERRDFYPARPSPILVAEEADRFIAPALLRRLIASESTRLVLIPEIAERLLRDENGPVLEKHVGRFIWFRTHSGIGKTLYDKMRADRKGLMGTAHDISCATLDLNARIIHENGVSTFEDLAAASGHGPRRH